MFLKYTLENYKLNLSPWKPFNPFNYTFFSAGKSASLSCREKCVIKIVERFPVYIKSCVYIKFVFLMRKEGSLESVDGKFES